MFASLVGRSRPTWAGLHTCSHLPTPLTADLSDVSVFGEWLSFEAAFSLDVWCETTPEGTLRALWSKFITSFMTRWPPTSDWPPPSHHEPCFVLPWCSVTFWRAFVWGFCSNICTLCMKRAAVQSHSVVRSGCDLVWILNPAQIIKSLKTSQFYRHKFSRGQQLPSDSFKIRFDAGDNTSRLLMKPRRYLPSYILKQERVKLDFKLQKKKISQLMQLHTDMM